jgi:glycosyltransferase involved in cell wall biosynthesis
MTGRKLSVLTSVYNGAPYLRQSVQSILDQTFDDFEFVIIDDASRDRTPEILDRFRDPRIVRLRNERNLGLARSLNRGLEAARGQYIARHDADDWSHPQRLGEQAAYLDARPHVGVVATTTEWIAGDGRVLRTWRQPTDNAGIQETLLKYCCLVHGSTMIRPHAVKEVGGYDDAMRTGQDYDLWLRMSETWDMACLPQVRYQYRWHGDMVSVGRKEEQAAHADQARVRAVNRRKTYATAIWGRKRGDVPPRLRAMSRRELARRYTWWSAGARAMDRRAALWFLLVALIADPSTPEIWSYVRGILGRKLGLGDNRPEPAASRAVSENRTSG